MTKWKRLLSRDANILTKYLVLRGIEAGPKYILPEWGGFQNQFWSWKDGVTGIHFLKTELKEYSDFIVNAAKKQDNFSSNYKDASIKICNEVVNNIAILSSDISDKISTKNLIKKFEQFCKEYERLGATIFMTLEEIQDQVVSKIKNTEDLSILLTPESLSIETEEELARLKIVKYIDETHRDLFMSKNPTEIAHKLNQFPILERMINDHVNNYCWIPLNFEKDLWDQSFFIQMFKSYIEEKYDYQSRILEIKSHGKNSELKERVISNLDDKTSLLASLLEATTAVRLYRATMFSSALYEGYPILKQIARRTNISLKWLNYYTTAEIIEALSNNSDLASDVASSRKKAFAMLVIENKYTQYEGGGAIEVINREYPEEKFDNLERLEGMGTYPGHAVGKVKIIFDARDMDKVEDGDVIVCEATNPDLVIAMRKAAAIITNEGGITSHAAIVSRELKTPCIIGTKNATKILKDGDLVEVDADKGVIKKVNK